jgi:hypothetical protein
MNKALLHLQQNIQMTSSIFIFYVRQNEHVMAREHSNPTTSILKVTLLGVGINFGRKLRQRKRSSPVPNCP